MSENKEESNSTSSDVKEEDGPLRAEDVESEKNSVKDSGREDSIKDSEEESEEEGMGLLDRPVEVSGCRARKKVERLEVSFATAKEKTQPIPEGKGKKLGECPRIELQIQKTSNNDLKPLHRILFNRVGGATVIKRNIKKFSGFTFEKNSSEYERKKAQIEKLTGPILKQMCGVLDIERGGLKDDIVNRVLEFLLDPKDSGKSVPKKKTASKDKKKANVEKDKKSKAKIEKEEESESDTPVESVSDKNSDNEKGDVESENDSDSEGEKETLTVKKTVTKTKKIKKTKQKKAKGLKRKLDDDSDGSSSEPLTKRKGPTDFTIKRLVKRILKTADLQEITMKKVIKQVADTYPTIDLAQKKAFIKSTIKSCLS